MAKQESKGTKTSISTSCLFLASWAWLKLILPTFAYFLYLLPCEGPLILPFSIINSNKPIFSYSLFVTFLGQLLQQDQSRCQSRWENLGRSEDQFLNFFVSSPFETWPHNKDQVIKESSYYYS